MKKKFAILLTTMCTLALVGCNGGGQKEEAAKPKNLIFSTTLTSADPFAQGAKLFCERVGEISNGKLTIEYHDSGSLYNQDENPIALAEGRVDFADSGMEDFDAAPKYSMFKSAYIFDDAHHAIKVYSSDLGKEIFDDIAKKVGIRYLGGSFYSTRQINLADGSKEVLVPEDMKSILLRMPGGADWTALGKAIGTNPTSVTINETYMALKTGQVDGQDNGLSVSKANSFDEVTEKVIMTDHLVWCLHLAANEKTWQSLTADEKVWVQKAADEAHKFVSDLALKSESDLVADYKAQGIEIIYPDKAPWIEYASNYYRSKDAEKLTATWDWDLYKKVRDMSNQK